MRSPSGPRACSSAPIASSAEPQSPCGSACASEPQTVPRLRTIGSEIMRRRVPEGRERPVEELGPLAGLVADERADAQAAVARDGERVEVRDPVDVDERRRRGEGAELQHRDQALAAGQHLRLPVEPFEDPDSLLERVRREVLEAARVQETPPSASSDGRSDNNGSLTASAMPTFHTMSPWRSDRSRTSSGPSARRRTCPTAASRPPSSSRSRCGGRSCSRARRASGKTEVAKTLARHPRRRADPAAVLRGHRRGAGALRVGLRAPAPVRAQPPGRGRRPGPADPGAVRAGLPRRAAAPARDPGRLGRRPADRRARPGRRRVRGVPARGARRLRGDDPGDRHDLGRGAARRS